MAPELRKRKSKTAFAAAVEESPAAAKKDAKKSPKVEKRKANEDASPVATKKQKASKTKAVESPAPKKEKKKAAEEVAQEGKEEEVAIPAKTATKKEKSAKKGAAKSKKEVVPELDEQASEEEDAAEEADEEVDAATEALVETLDAGAEDNMEDEPVSTFKKGQDVGKAPKPKKGPKINGAKPSGTPGVMYLGSIPHGFYEHEIREYFSQFGEITRLRVVRNKKTGASKHRAFVEFADAEVADIAARTMDSYLLFGHILRAKVVQPSQVHPDLFKGANRRFKAIPWNKMAGRHLENALGESKWQGRVSKEEKRRASRAEKLKALGYKFEAPELKAPKAVEVIEAPTEEPVKAVEAPAPEAEEEKAEETAEKAEEPTSISQPKTKKAKKGGKAKKVKA